jgi:hypothetical protein
MMRPRFLQLVAISVIACGCVSIGASAARARPQKDYLSEEEADKVRDAPTPSLRIKLYVSFAADRLAKFDYELKRANPERRRAEILNVLLNDYTGCMDDGADQIGVAKEKQADIHDALKLMEKKYTDFLAQLEAYDKDGPDLDIYRDTLEDAIEGTKDALSDVQNAQKEMLPPPVRRKQ